MDRIKMIKEMNDYGYVFEDVKEDDKFEKIYKCYMSKKCNDEKFLRIKKMFDYCKDDEEFIKVMGNDYDKLCESFKSEKRGIVIKVDYDNMSINKVFELYKLGVKEVCKKGYIVENDIYIKK